MTRSSAWTLVTLFAFVGCGGFELEPWTPGEAHIELTVVGDVDPGAAWAAVVGDADHVARVEPGTRLFVLPDVPAPGRAEIVAADGLGGAVRRSVDVLSGRVTRIELVLPRAATIRGSVTLEGEADSVEVGIDGLPLRTEADGGRFVLSDVPAGCVDVEATADDHAPARVRVCAGAGESVSTGLHLRLLEVGPCLPCSADTQCGGLCAEHAVEDLTERVCLSTCEDDGACPPGFGCEGLPGRRVCAPEGTSCAAYRHMSEASSCTGDDQCGLEGVGDGVCRQGACTVTCSESDDCPDGTECSEPGEEPGGVCR